MLSQQLRTLFKELGYEVYLNRESEPRICSRYDKSNQYGKDCHMLKSTHDILAFSDGTPIGGKFEHNFERNSGPVMTEFLVIDFLKERELSFMISKASTSTDYAKQAEKATIKMEHYEQGENFNDVTITLNKDGSIQIDTADNNCYSYSLDDSKESHKELANYLNNIDPRIMLFVKYCAHVIGIQDLTLLINAIQEYQKGRSLVLIPTFKNAPEEVAASIDNPHVA